MNYTVAVVTITRHRPKLLQRAIASVQAQTYPRSCIFHYIVVDDCSETWTSLQDISLPENVHVDLAARESEEQSGPARLAKLRNASVRQAKSKWISFLDDDNEFMPNHVESLVQCALETRCRAVHSHMQLLTRDGQPYLEERLPWARDPQVGRQEYKKLCARGVFQQGTNISHDRVDPLGTEDSVRSVDTGEWLFERLLLIEYPFPTQYSDDDWEQMTTEDDKLMGLLVRHDVRIATTGLPTLKYYLGGYSNTFRFD